MEIWISMDNDRFRLPVLPPTVEISSESLNTVININELGDVNLLGKSGLKSLSIDTFMPNQNYSFVEYAGFPKPYQAIEKLEKWKESEKPMRLIITSTPINMLISIESLNFGERDGTGDLYYSIELLEYIDPKTRTVVTQQAEPKRPVPEAKKIDEKTYVVKSGDTLWAIAKRFYGNGVQFPKIYDKNKKVIGSDPNRIFPGQKFVIP